MAKNLREISKTALSGVSATILDVAMLVFLVELFQTPVVLATFCAALFGAGLSFVLSKYWAFRDRSKVTPVQVFSFAGVAFVSAVLVAILVWGQTEVGVPYLGAKAIAAIMVFLSWSFPAQKYVVFARPRRTFIPSPGDSLA